MKRIIFFLSILFPLTVAAQWPMPQAPAGEKNYVYKDTVTYSADGHKMVTQM